MITGKEFAKLFSENEELTEKMFSTGDKELDELLEKVYSEGVEDGYDYAQKEFGKKEYSLKKREKLFFDYKEYAKKHGEEAAKDLKKVRDLYAELAKDAQYNVKDAESAQYYVSKGKRLSRNSKKALKDMKEVANDIKAKELFEKNRPFVEKFKDKVIPIKEWSKRNPGKAAVIATGLLAADAGLIYGAKKAVDKKKNKKESDKKDKD